VGQSLTLCSFCGSLAQLWGLQHALAVAAAMERVLVLPLLMTIRSPEELLQLGLS
jgi:hypothetical protein